MPNSAIESLHTCHLHQVLGFCGFLFNAMYHMTPHICTQLFYRHWLMGLSPSVAIWNRRTYINYIVVLRIKDQIRFKRKSFYCISSRLVFFFKLFTALFFFYLFKVLL